MADTRDLDGSGRDPARRTTSCGLIAGLQARDEDAWSRMVELYLPLVHGWCRRAGLPRSDAADVVQEVFRAAAAGVAKFRHDRADDTFRGWLRGITRHKVLDYWRRHPTEGRAVGGSDAQQRLQTLMDSAEDSVQAVTERSQLVHRALQMVRAEFENTTWEAFCRTTIDEQRPQDVATILGVTVNAIYKAKSRVLHRLREVLGDLSTDGDTA